LSLKPKATKQTRAIFATLWEKLWNCYQASNKSSFSPQIRRLYEWAVKNNIPPAMLDKIDKVTPNITYFHTIYQHSQAYRTSNLLDRLMVRMDHRLFSMPKVKTFVFQTNRFISQVLIDKRLFIYIPSLKNG